MSATVYNLIELQLRAIADSRSWFPAVHETKRTALVHFGLGIAGEAGELVEALMERDSDDGVKAEVADTAIYLLDICTELGYWLFDGLSDGMVWRPAWVEGWDARWTVAAVGQLVNLIKKWNRGSIDDLELGSSSVKYATAIWLSLERIADELGTTLPDVIEAKRIVLVDRWGSPS